MAWTTKPCGLCSFGILNDSFMCISSSQHPWRQMLSSPFYSWGNRSAEMLSNSLKDLTSKRQMNCLTHSPAGDTGEKSCHSQWPQTQSRSPMWSHGPKFLSCHLLPPSWIGRRGAGTQSRHSGYRCVHPMWWPHGCPECPRFLNEFWLLSLVVTIYVLFIYFLQNI